jgi:hypothetical protein
MTHKIITVCFMLSFITLHAYADQGSPCPPANQNNIYDPRVPPAGVYSNRGPNGSYNTTYTTGEKAPYLTDNGCNNNSTTAQPYVFAPNRPR